MKQYIEAVTDEFTGLPIEGAEVWIYDDDNNLATLYASDGTTEIDNPLTTNEDGEFSFYQQTTELTALVYYGGRLRRRLRLLVGGGYSVIAQASAQAALNAAGVEDYANTAAGLSGTSIDETFWVDNGDGTGSIYRHDAGPTATFLSKFIKDPGGSGASGNIGHIGTGAGSVTRPVRDKLREITTFADKAAPTDGSNATTAINNALATARNVEAGSGNYRAQNIVLTEAGQQLAARGTVNILRNANGALINTSASDITINGIAFYGDDPTYTGDLLTFTGQRGNLLFCAARDTGVNKALKITGSAWLLFGANDKYEGDVQITTDGVGGVSQYHNILATRIAGALSLVDTSFVSVTGCLLSGTVTVDKGIETAGGHGARILTTRITGATTITQSNTCLGSGTSSSQNVTFGDGSTTFTGLAVDPSYVQAAGTTFSVTAGSRGVFHVANLLADGVTLTIPESVRQRSNIYHGEIAYTPTISGGGGSFSLGNGTLSAKYSQQGNIINGYIELVIGSTTTLPTSGLFATVPIATGGRPILCQIEITDTGTGSYSAAGRIFSDGSRILGWRQADGGIDTLFTATSPVALGNTDAVRWTFSYALAGL